LEISLLLFQFFFFCVGNLDLQKKFTDLEDQQQQTRSVEASADLSNILRDKIATLEQDLRQERDLHRKAKDQAAKSAQNSVAELELRDYQRTIAQLNEKVTAKDDCILRITEQLHSSEQMLVTKHRTIQEQTVKLEELTEKNGRLEASLSDAHRNSLERERTIASLRDDVTALNEQVRG
jgi:myosin heavy subunit